MTEEQINNGSAILQSLKNTQFSIDTLKKLLKDPNLTLGVVQKDGDILNAFSIVLEPEYLIPIWNNILSSLEKQEILYKTQLDSI